MPKNHADNLQKHGTYDVIIVTTIIKLRLYLQNIGVEGNMNKNEMLVGEYHILYCYLCLTLPFGS